MDEPSILQYIADTFAGIQIVPADGNTFFFHDPERKFPFATLVTKDDYDNVSNLSRPGVFRLNIGVGRPTFLELFPPSAESGEPAHDFTALDRLMPHPVYGGMFWVCVLNPGDETFEKTVRPLLAEAYDLAVARLARREG
jgi:hypothetical protein